MASHPFASSAKAVRWKKTPSPPGAPPASDGHHAITSGGHTSIGTGKSLLASAKEAVRLFAYNTGIRLVSAGADIEVTALKKSIHLLAKLDIKMEANRISITAKESVTINGGTSYTRWDAGGIVHGTPGLWREHAASHSLVGPDCLPVPDRPSPPVVCKECMAKAAARAEAVVPRQ